MTEKPSEGLYAQLAKLEKKLAEADDREPEGWFWVEGMDKAEDIDFSKIDTEEETRDD